MLVLTVDKIKNRNYVEIGFLSKVVLLPIFLNNIDASVLDLDSFFVEAQDMDADAVIDFKQILLGRWEKDRFAGQPDGYDILVSGTLIKFTD